MLNTENFNQGKSLSNRGKMLARKHPIAMTCILSSSETLGLKLNSSIKLK